MRILIALIILSGIFSFKVENNLQSYSAQLVFFIFSVGALGSYLIYQKNKWIGLLSGLFTIGFLRTYLFRDVELAGLYQETLIGVSIFLLYYVVRKMKVTEDILKWFLIPVGLNIVLILAQKFDGNVLPYIPEKMIGFLGNPSVSSCFITLSIPIVLRYYPKCFPILLITSWFAQSRVPFIAMIISGMVYLYYTNKKYYRVTALAIGTVLMLFTLHCFMFGIKDTALGKSKIFGTYWYKERGSMIVGTLDGIMHNPILGWGIGSFEPIMKKIPEIDSYYCGAYFNEGDYSTPHDITDLKSYMNHPHNEYIYGWWNVGIGYIILVLCLMRNISKRFTRKNVLPFSILVGGMVMGLGYFFAYPVWFFLILALGVYDNQEVVYAEEKRSKKDCKKGSKSCKTKDRNFVKGISYA